MAQQKFLVTGATGDTGGYTVERLLQRGHVVRALAGEGERIHRLDGEIARRAVQPQKQPQHTA